MRPLVGLLLFLEVDLALGIEANSFVDPGLEGAVRAVLQKPEEVLTEVDLLALTQLDASGRHIRYLGGIEQAQNLSVLLLADNQIEDLAPLASLTRLTSLDLANNQIEDLSPLTGLGQLAYLNLEFNRIADLSPLAALARLKVLILDHNAVRDLSPLLGLAQLSSVELGGNPLEEVSQTQHLLSLRARGVQVGFDLPGDQPGPAEVDLPSWEPFGPLTEELTIGVHDIAVAPSDPDMIYCLAENGLWRSEDGGANWTKANLMFHGTEDNWASLFVDALDPFTLYWPYEWLKSRDGGMHWESMISPQAEEDCAGLGASSPGNLLLAADPVRSGRLYGIDCGDLVLSEDGGTSWKRAKSQDGATVRLEGVQPFVLVHPINSQAIYAGFIMENGVTYLARTLDGGQTWSAQIRLDRPLKSLAIDPQHPEYLYAVDQDSILHSADGGKSWKALSRVPGSVSLQLLANPQQPSRLFAWALRPYLTESSSSPLWRSVDGGVQWEPVDMENVSQVVLFPQDPEQAFLVVDNRQAPGLLYRTQNWGRSWEQVEIKEKIRPVEMIDFALNGTLFLGGGQKLERRWLPSLLKSEDKGLHWAEQVQEVVDTEAKSLGPLHLVNKVGLGPIVELYVEPTHLDNMVAYTLGGFMHTEDGGHTWQVLSPGIRPWSLTGSLFIPPSSPAILGVPQVGRNFYLVTVSRLYRSSDGGQTWDVINPLNQFVSHALRVPGNPEEVYATVGDWIWRTEDGGENWQRAGKTPGLSYIIALAAHSLRPEKLYAANSFGFYASEDGGKVWTLLTELDKEVVFRAGIKIRFALQDPGTIYLVMGRKLLETMDGGKTWKSIGEGMKAKAWFNDVAVDPADPSLVYAATPWGLYRWDKDKVTAVEEENRAVPVTFALGQNYPNPFNAWTTVSYQLPSSTPVKLVVYNLAGQVVRVLMDGVQEAGSYRLGWNGRGKSGELLASGVYLYRLSTNTSQETRKLLLLK